MLRFIGEGPGCVAYSLDAFLPEDLDSCHDPPEGCDDELRNRIADSGHAIDDLLHQTAAPDEGGHLAEDVHKEGADLLQHGGEEVTEGLEHRKGGIDSLHGFLVFLEVVLELEGKVNYQSQDSKEGSLGKGLEAILHSVDVHPGCLAEVVHAFLHPPESLGDAFGVVTHVALEVTLQGIHRLELVIDFLDLRSQLLPSGFIGGGTELTLEGRHLVDKAVVGLGQTIGLFVEVFVGRYLPVHGILEGVLRDPQFVQGLLIVFVRQSGFLEGRLEVFDSCLEVVDRDTGVPGVNRQYCLDFGLCHIFS